ncbi:hypothetical protein AMTRI_Chr12g270550 [Amborella trichopoda]
MLPQGSPRISFRCFLIDVVLCPVCFLSPCFRVTQRMRIALTQLSILILYLLAIQLLLLGMPGNEQHDDESTLLLYYTCIRLERTTNKTPTPEYLMLGSAHFTIRLSSSIKAAEFAYPILCFLV